ncbi:MAG: 4,5-dihydroxyphthalate decarboxylase [Betaproteobacteria bacterium]|nr:4,5-dihydroxyphthalate decarboxylase [Betaproteobacteria bacterium]
MANLPLTLAIGNYEHTRDIVSGDVRAEGIDLTGLRLPIEELLFRFIRHREWGVSEMGLGPHATLISRGDDGMVGIPVFTSRVFRQSSLYLRTDAGIRSPADLAGKRIGVPEWAMTAVIYARALLQHGHGVDLRSIEWTQAGVNEPGRVDKMKLQPPGFSLTPEPARSLSEMLLAGDLDAIISARPPTAFDARDRRIRRAWDDLFGEEVAYWKATRIFPIMHLVVIRRDVYERNPWVALNLFKAFDEAKRRALERIGEMAASHFPIPWLPHHVALAEEQMGKDYWPYGIEANRATLDAFCQYAYEQGACQRLLKVEELFAPQMQGVSRV